MEIEFQKVYRFNLDKNKAEEIKLENKENDFNAYLRELMTVVLDDPRSKRYLFPKELSVTKTLIKQLIEGKKDEAANDFALRLLKIENDVQDRIEHLEKEVQKGIMIQALVNTGKRTVFMIIKAEHFDFINELDNKKATGLPIKKKIFKSFSAAIDGKNNVRYAKVSDNRSVISTYWWKDFLELDEEYTDEYNTEVAFAALENKVLNKIKEDYPADYMYLRNATVQYFRSQKEFVLEDYLDNIIRSYEPEGDGLDVADMGRRIEALPEKSNFEGRFNIVKDKIKKRIIKKLRLSDQLDLVIKEEISWGKTVSTFKQGGAKFIQIRTDEGYDYFNKK